MLTETFNTEARKADFTAAGYRCFQTFARQQQLRGRPAGGIAILVKASLQPKLVFSQQHCVAVETTNINLLCFYYPPDQHVDDIIIETHRAITACDSKANTIIGGDFNCRSDSGARGAMLIDSLVARGLSFINEPDQPTYMATNGTSAIDFVFSTLTDGPKITIQHHPVRKHQRVHVRLRAAAPIEPPAMPKLKRTVDAAALMEKINQPAFQQVTVQQDVEELSSAITSAIIACTPQANAYAGRSKPWYDDTCRQQRRLVSAIMSNLAKTDALRRPALLDEYRVARRAYKAVTRQKRNNHENAVLMQKLRQTAVTPWTLFRKPAAYQQPPIPDETWQQHFNEIYNPTGRLVLGLPGNGQIQNDEWYNRRFTVDEVCHAILRAANGKAAGPDRLFNEHLKLTAQYMAPIWTELFNNCLDQAVIPEAWRTCTLKPLYKGKGPTEDPNNYRGISLQSCPFKVFTATITRRIISNCRHHIPAEQHGFLENKSVKAPMQQLVVAAARQLHQRGGLYCLFVDFKKAFDFVHRGRLIAKLQTQFGIDGKLLNLIASIYSQNNIRVRDLHGPAIEQTRGVQQGDCLSPTAFILYIADLATELRLTENASFSFYADDLVVYSTDADSIRQVLLQLSLWCRTNHIQVNTSKTMVMKSRRGGRLAATDRFFFEGAELQITGSYTYLGLTVQTSLSFSQHVARRKVTGLAAIGSLKHLQKISLQTTLQIYNLKITPIVSYGLDVAAPYISLQNLKDIDKVKSALLKAALGLHKSASSTLAHQLFDTPTMSWDLKNTGHAFDGNTWQHYIQYREEREMHFVAENFTEGPAFTSFSWKNANFTKRHILTRTTAHGFHHIICTKESYHQPLHNCICKCCFLSASDRYHILYCRFRTFFNHSLSSFIQILQ
jgi:hypothetical protein